MSKKPKVKQGRAKKKPKRKDINELTKGFEEFIKGKELNPKHKQDFERIAPGKRIKRVS